MSPIDSIMVNTYYQLIKAGRRTLDDIPAHVPQEVKDAVQELLEKEQGAS